MSETDLNAALAQSIQGVPRSLCSLSDNIDGDDGKCIFVANAIFGQLDRSWSGNTLEDEWMNINAFSVNNDGLEEKTKE